MVDRAHGALYWLTVRPACAAGLLAATTTAAALLLALGRRLSR